MLPAVNVYMPKDRVTNEHQGYGFVEFRSEEDADYAIKVRQQAVWFSVSAPATCGGTACDTPQVKPERLDPFLSPRSRPWRGGGHGCSGRASSLPAAPSVPAGVVRGALTTFFTYTPPPPPPPWPHPLIHPTPVCRS